MKTTEIARLIKKRDLSDDEAYDLAEAINGKSGLATKEGLSKVEHTLKGDLLKAESRLKEDIASLRTSNKFILTLIIISFSITTSLLVVLLSLVVNRFFS